MTTTVRLHISPLAPETLPAIIGPSLRDQAKNISYHTIQTFPENSYGYVELPAMEAEKVKKKLNGSILKGKKMKVEEARPSKRQHAEMDEETTATSTEAQPPKAKKLKKGKKDRSLLSGRELTPERKVMRGWTESKQDKPKKERSTKKDKSKAERPASKYSEKEELLFRTKIPPNKKDVVKSEKTKKNKKKAQGDLVHEFEKTTKQPSFLRSSDSSGPRAGAEYVDGKGWVNEDGNVVEQEIEKVSRKRKAVNEAQSVGRLSTKKRPPPREPSPSISSTSSTEDDASSEDNMPQFPQNDDTSSSGSSSDDESDTSTVTSKAEEDAAAGRDKLTSKSISPPAEVHPLEALFKKPGKPGSQDVAKPSLEIQTSFSFFGAGDENDIENEDNPQMPGTPFNSQDVRSRTLRSAAPTPDTAHPSRFNSYSSLGEPGNDDESAEEDAEDDHLLPEGGDVTPTQKSQSQPESDFAKMFWEKRGDNNRAWKARRRAVLKEKRQRENRARRPKNW